MDLKHLPKSPGVYLLKKNADILYIGKALNVYDRVKTHLVAKTTPESKSACLRAEVNKVDFIPVQSDFDALILEINLIKKYLPVYNSALKDGKDYLYLKITTDPFPRVVSVRRQDLEPNLYYLGPFPNASMVKQTLRSLRPIFPFCNELKKSGKACFYYHLGQCSGPCASQISQKDYCLIIKKLVTLLEGKNDILLNNWERQMLRFSRASSFEKAARIRDQIEGIKYLRQKNRIADYLIKPGLADDLRENEAQGLGVVLGIKQTINRIEGYDISHIGGSNTVGSMVVFTGGIPDKAEYRRFRIKKAGIDDYASLQEVLERRFHHDWQTPDLIVIDGGKGQLTAAKSQMDRLNLNVPVISLAKKEEEIFTTDRGRVVLKRSDPALQILQRLRDEAHRFAITYHRKLRQDAFLAPK